MATLTPLPKMQFFNTDGGFLSGGKVYTYEAGTSTPLETYTDQGGGTPNANPVILDSKGQAAIWLGTEPYKIVVHDSADVLQSDGGDNIYPIRQSPQFDTVSNYADLAAAVTAIGATETTLVIDTAQVIAEGTTVTTPTTMTLEFIRGGSIDGVAGGGTETLAVNGDVIAGDYQIFGDNLSITAIKPECRILWFSDLATAVTALGSTETSIIINVPTVIADGVTVTTPSTLTLWRTDGGLISGTAGGGTETLVVGTPPINGDQLMFGADLVVDSTSNIGIGNIKWWATGDGVTDDTAGIAAAIVATDRLHWPEGVYLTDPITKTGTNMQWTGDGSNNNSPKTIIKAAGSQTHVLQIKGRGNIFEDIQFSGDFLTTVAVVEVGQGTSKDTFNRCSIVDTVVNTGTLLYLNSGSPTIQIDLCTFETCEIRQNTGHALYSVLSVGTNAIKNRIINTVIAGGDTLVFLNGGSIEFENVFFFDWTSASGAVYLNGGSFTIRGGYTEGTPSLPFTGGVEPTTGSNVANVIEDFNFAAIDVDINFWTTQPILLKNNYISGNVQVTRSTKTNYKYGVVSIGNIFASKKTFTGTAAGDVVEFGNNVVHEVGAHDGAGNAAVLTDTSSSWTVNGLRGYYIYNVTDDSSAQITANTSDTITGVLAGGTDNDWDIGDAYEIIKPAKILLTAAGVGVVGTSERIIDRFSPITDNTDGAVTYTGAQVVGGLVRRATGDELTGAVTDVFPSAVDIFTAMKVRDYNLLYTYHAFDLYIFNEDSTHTIDVDGTAAGITLVPANPTPIPANSTGHFKFVAWITTFGSEAIRAYYIGSSPH